MQKKKSNKATRSDDEDELQLFRDAVKDITPLRHDKVIHQTSKPRHQTSAIETQETDQIIDILSDEAEMESIQPLDRLSYSHSGIQKRVLKKLRRGQYITIDTLDLHGLTLKQAKKYLLHFLATAFQVESSCVSIIHGKGHRSGNKEPVLKQHTNHWLKQHPRVLAFHSAQPKDGGTGAVYVLLRRTPLPK
jgi:DNA-nicking Smr family endonuclease